ncbi:CesT family type III secretion system chaperone [Pleionea sp. CnH1-48]|uniref:CesT family type III secretion system chaperone n=1 Tax=Pleionea sp. CnH1-48 TaxID=2954494 RepID=UPI002096F202|nr:CesT family type III secretion system chaperone [Pleionea sp. CnH1-48]MCO7226453.1 type III secretion system chaperone [Pleionea sp. CnH1-48]
MTNLASYQKVMDEVMKSLGFEEYSLDDNHGVGFVFDEKVEVNQIYFEDSDTVLFVCYGMELSKENNESVYARLLVANTGFNSTGGITLGICEHSNRLTASFQRGVDGISASDVFSIYQALADICVIWSNELDDDAKNSSCDKVHENTNELTFSV